MEIASRDSMESLLANRARGDGPPTDRRRLNRLAARAFLADASRRSSVLADAAERGLVACAFDLPVPGHVQARIDLAITLPGPRTPGDRAVRMWLTPAVRLARAASTQSMVEAAALPAIRRDPFGRDAYPVMALKLLHVSRPGPIVPARLHGEMLSAAAVIERQHPHCIRLLHVILSADPQERVPGVRSAAWRFADALTSAVPRMESGAPGAWHAMAVSVMPPDPDPLPASYTAMVGAACRMFETRWALGRPPGCSPQPEGTAKLTRPAAR
jgi:hypothetical protein